MSPRSLRRAYAPKPAKMLERPVQRGARDLLAPFGIRAVHVANGAHLAGGKIERIKQMAALRADGLETGFPDLIVFGRRPLQVGFMEAKREGKLELHPVNDADQIVWRDRLVGLGFPWALIQRPEDALAAVKQWGWI